MTLIEIVLLILIIACAGLVGATIASVLCVSIISEENKDEK